MAPVRLFMAPRSIPPRHPAAPTIIDARWKREWSIGQTKASGHSSDPFFAWWKDRAPPTPCGCPTKPPDLVPAVRRESLRLKSAARNASGGQRDDLRRCSAPSPCRASRARKPMRDSRGRSGRLRPRGIGSRTGSDSIPRDSGRERPAGQTVTVSNWVKTSTHYRHLNILYSRAINRRDRCCSCHNAAERTQQAARA